MSWICPVFSVCPSGNSWLWAAWNSSADAYAFLKKTNKDLTIDCLFYAEASSKEAAKKTAKNLLGVYLEESENALEAFYHLVNQFEPQIGELGNGRFVRNIFDRCIAIQSNRLAALSHPSTEELRTFLFDDIPTQEQIVQSLL